MKSLLYIIRSFLISPEILVSLILVFIHYFYAHPFSWADTALAEASTTVLIGPFSAIIIAVSGLFWKILFPRDNNEVLVEWDLYPLYRTTTFIGGLFVILGLLCNLTGVFGRGQLPVGYSALLIAIGYSVAIISICTMFAAALKVQSFLKGGN